MKSKKWTESEVEFMREHYPQRGKMWCAEQLDRPEASIRQKASRLGLRQDRSSEFFQDWQNRAAQSKVGKKRPLHGEMMREMWASGMIMREFTEEHRKAQSERFKEWYKHNDHPRGFKGGKHTLEAKEKMRKALAEYQESITPEQRAEITLKQLKTKEKRGNLYKPRQKTTWKQGWREIGGFRKYYRSRWEANYARYLQYLLEKGDIQKWEHEPKTFWFENIKRGTRSYLPDFLVTENSGDANYHEVKGWMDAKSKTKLKRFAKYYPEETLILIQKKEYAQIEKSLGSIIEGWEF